jgi:hypothetical protein
VKFQQLLEAAGLKPQRYSGRGMNGRDCLGTQVSDPLQVTAGIFAYLGTRELATKTQADDMKETFLECTGAFDYTKVDRMGHGSILYWPNLEYIDPVPEGDGD